MIKYGLLHKGKLLGIETYIDTVYTGIGEYQDIFYRLHTNSDILFLVDDEYTAKKVASFTQNGDYYEYPMNRQFVNKCQVVKVKINYEIFTD